MKSDHFDGRRFVNPTGTAGQPFTAVPRMLLEARTPWPPQIDEPPQRPPALDGAAAVVTFTGHADAGAALLRADSAGSKPCAVGWIHARAARRAHPVRRRQRVWTLLPRHPAAARSNRPGASPHRRVRAALVHARRSHESGGGG